MPTLAQGLQIWSAANTPLRSSTRIDLHQLPTSVLSFVGELSKEGRPSGIVNRLGQHPAGESFDIQIFDGNQSVQRNQPTGQFVVKVGPLISDLNVNTLKFLYRFPPPARAFLAPGNFALCPSQFGFGVPELSRVIYFSSIRKHGKAGQPNVYAHSIIGSRQGNGFNFTTKARIPAARFSFDRAGLDLTFQQSVQFDLDGADLGERQATIFDSETHLRVGETIVAGSSAEARETGLLSAPAAAEETSKGFFNSVQDILKNLAVDLAAIRSLRLNLRKLGRLPGESYRDSALPGIAAFLQGGVVQLLAYRQSLLASLRLLAIRIKSVLKRLSVAQHIALLQRAKRRPRLKQNSCASTVSAGGNANSEIPASKYEMTRLSVDAPACGCRIVDRLRQVDVHGRALFPAPEHQREVPEQQREALFANDLKRLRSIRTVDTSGKRPRGICSNRLCAGSICIPSRCSSKKVYSKETSNARTKAWPYILTPKGGGFTATLVTA